MNIRNFALAAAVTAFASTAGLAGPVKAQPIRFYRRRPQQPA